MRRKYVGSAGRENVNAADTGETAGRMRRAVHLAARRALLLARQPAVPAEAAEAKAASSS